MKIADDDDNSGGGYFVNWTAHDREIPTTTISPPESVLRSSISRQADTGREDAIAADGRRRWPMLTAWWDSNAVRRRRTSGEAPVGRQETLYV